MSQSASSPVVHELEHAVWRHHVGGNLPIDIRTQVFSNTETEGLGGPTALLLPGYGERAHATKQGLAFLAEVGVPAVAAVLNADVIPATRQDIESFIRTVGPTVATDLRERTPLQEKAPIIGHSLGGLVAGLSLEQDPDSFGNVGILEGVGTTTHALRAQYARPAAQRRAFTRRFAHVLVGPHRATPLNLLRAGAAIGVQLAEDAWPPQEHRFRRQFSIASQTDIVPTLLTHAEAGNHVVVLAGKKDPLIRGTEVLTSFEHHYREMHRDEPDRGEDTMYPNIDGSYERFGDNLHVQITPERHAFMGFAAGGRQLHTVAAMLRLGNET